ELDEEMVYESRVGQSFTLGNSNWRIDAIGHDRVLVSPAPPGAARIPFWHGEGLGRPFELGESMGCFLAEMEQRLAKGEGPAVVDVLCSEYALDDVAAQNLVEFLRGQIEAAGQLATRRRLVVERFSDELGEPRVVIHSPLGGRVNGALAFALAARLRQTTAMEVEQLYTDDGIVFRFPADAQPPIDLLRQIDSDTVEDLIVSEVGASAMFGTIFRQAAARALLLPRQRPDRRSPLWLQRIKAADLLQVARRYESFPIVIETYRECLQDVLDVPHLRQILSEIEVGEVEVVQVDTPFASPFAAEILFSFIMAFMYGTDAPRAERKSAMLSLNRDLLADVLDDDAVRDLLEPAAIAQLEGRLQRTLPGWRAESADELIELLLRLVDLTEPEIAARFEGDYAPALHQLLDSGQAVRVPRAEGRGPRADGRGPSAEGRGLAAGGRGPSAEGRVPSAPSAALPAAADQARVIPAEYATSFRDAVRLASDPHLAPVDPLVTQHPAPGTAARLDLLRRFAANHGPFRVEQVQGRYGFDPLPELEELHRQQVVARGDF